MQQKMSTSTTPTSTSNTTTTPIQLSSTPPATNLPSGTARSCCPAISSPSLKPLEPVGPCYVQYEKRRATPFAQLYPTDGSTSLSHLNGALIEEEDGDDNIFDKVESKALLKLEPKNWKVYYVHLFVFMCFF